LGRATGRPTAIDLFAGAGGLSRGLERAGFDVLVGADSDDWAMRTHDANVGGISWAGDLSDPSDFLRTLKVWGIEHVDLVAGGVPCQPFSRAGRSRIRDLVEIGERTGHDARADLWGSFIQVVDALRPEAVLVENVPDLPRWNDGAVLIGLYDSLQRLGYQVEGRILDSYRYGVPQHRQRLILIGFTGNRVPLWPEPVDQTVSLRDAIGDLPPIPPAQRAERLRFDPRRQRSGYHQLMRRDVPAQDTGYIYEHICRDVRADDREAFRLLGEGQTYIDLPERLRRYRSDVFTDKYKRLAWDELCRSITAHISKDGYWYIHPDQHRTLSVREAARVQSFPDDFRFAGTQTHRYRQIGNAVPVLLAEAIGNAVRVGLERPRRSTALHTSGLRDALLSWHRASGIDVVPWRRTPASPWLVLLGELLLARMRPGDAALACQRLEESCPNPGALLEMPDPEGFLAGLGVRDRARTAVAVASDLDEYFGGVVPDSETELLMLPGVGDYLARAVLTFGFGRTQVLVDQTTSRVAVRLTGRDDRRRYQLRLDLHRFAGAAGPGPSFNQALLDLGRVICRADRPRCESCPLIEHCETGRRMEEHALDHDAEPEELKVIAA